MKRVPYESLEYDTVMCLDGAPFTGVAYRLEDGEVGSEAAFVDGMLDGPNCVFFDDGTLAEESQMQWGTLHGKRREWHDKDVLAEEADYDCGFLVRRTRWDEAGAVVEQYAFEDDPAYKPGELLARAYQRLRERWRDIPRVPHDSIDYTDDGYYAVGGEAFTGIGYEIYDSGWLESETEYRHGQWWGLRRTWFAPERLESEAAMARGVHHGKERRRHHNGRLEEEADFEHAIRIRSTTWDQDGNVVETFVLDETSTNFESLQMFRARYGEND